MNKAPRKGTRGGAQVCCAATIAAAGLLAGCGGGGSSCEPAEVVGTAFTLDDGTATVSGTVTLPADAPDGRAIEVFVHKGGGAFGVIGESLVDQQHTCGDSFTFAIEQLEAGTYSLSARLQLPSDKEEIVYDHIGFYGGTVEDPVIDYLDATEITVTTEKLTGIDFGLGKVDPQ